MPRPPTPRVTPKGWPPPPSVSAGSGSTSTARRSSGRASTALQRRALAALDPSSSLARRLRIRLAAEQAYVDGRRQADPRRAEQARERADPLALAEALSLAHHCLLGPQHATLRLGLADELIAVSPSTGRAVDGLMGLAWRTVDLFLAGDRRAARSLGELREHLVIDRCDGLGYLVAALDVMLAMRDGRLAEAEELAEPLLRARGRRR